MSSIVVMSKLPFAHLPLKLHPSVKYYFYRSENCFVTFHVSERVQLRLSFFWRVNQRMLVVVYRRFGTASLTHLPDGTERLSRRGKVSVFVM